jgi:phospholipase/carboxylesterase
MKLESIRLARTAGGHAARGGLPLSGPIILPADGQPPREVIVFLHGLGSNGAIIDPLRSRLQSSFPRALIAAPDAPEPNPLGPDARQWWAHTDFKPRSLAAGVKRAAPALNRFLDTVLAATALGDDRLVLVGFSQGATLALHAGLTRRKRVGAVLAYSGVLAEKALPHRAFCRKPKVMVMCGVEDMIIPSTQLLVCAPRVAAYGCPVRSYVRKDLAHAVNGAGYALGARFIRQALDLPPDEDS